MNQPDAVIVDAVRTASGRGKPGGSLHGVHPVDLLATTIRALLDRTGIDPALVDDWATAVAAGLPALTEGEAAAIGRLAAELDHRSSANRGAA